MKNSTKYFSLVFAAIAAGVALFAFLNATFTAFLRGDVMLAIISSLAFLGFAAYDLSRRPTSLAATVHPARILRPTLPGSITARLDDPVVRSYRKDQIAA